MANKKTYLDKTGMKHMMEGLRTSLQKDIMREKVDLSKIISLKEEEPDPVTTPMWKEPIK